MSLQITSDDDRLTRFLQRYCPVFFVVRILSSIRIFWSLILISSQEQRPDKSNSLAYISEHRLHLFVVTVYVILAAALLFGAIYNLYFVKDDQKRLGLIAGYTIFFALCVGLLTNARRSEIFGACAAYAAVLVVFVSGDLGNSTNSTGHHGV